MMKQRKEGLTARDETSARQRYTQLGCAVCRIIRHRDAKRSLQASWQPHHPSTPFAAM